MVLKNSRHLSADREMNRLIEPICLVSYWISFLVEGCLISRIILIFLGFASISPLVIRNLRIFLDVTQKTHYIGFSFIWWHHNTSKASLRSLMWSNIWALFTKYYWYKPLYFIQVVSRRLCWLVIGKSPQHFLDQMASPGRIETFLDHKNYLPHIFRIHADLIIIR